MKRVRIKAGTVLATLLVAIIAVVAIVWWVYPKPLLDVDAHEVARIEIFNGNSGVLAVISDAEQIEKIVGNLNGVFIVKDELAGNRVGIGFLLKAILNNGEIHDLSIQGEDCVRDGPFFCKTKNALIDIDYLHELTQRS